MSLRRIAILTLALVAFAGPVPARATHTSRAAYVASFGLSYGVNAAQAGLGGYTFNLEETKGQRPASVKITDQASPSGLSVVMCQNINAADPDPMCGNGADPHIEFCSTTGFKSVTTDDRSVEVRIPGDDVHHRSRQRARRFVIPECRNIATSDTIDLVFQAP